MSTNPYAPQGFPNQMAVEPARTGISGLTVTLIAIGTLIVGLICGGVIGGVLGYGAGVATGAGLGKPPANVTMTITSPPRVKVGETFTVTVNLTNSGSTPVALSSLDIDDAFGSGLDLVSVDPKPATSDFDVDTNVTEHAFSPSLTVDKTRTVTFTFKAVKPGTYTGDWDAWYDSFNTHSQTPTIIIDP